LLPEEHAANDGTAGYVRDLDAALRRAGLSVHAARVALQVQSGTKSGMLSLIWPASQADAALNEPVAPGTEAHAAAVPAPDWAGPPVQPVLDSPLSLERDIEIAHAAPFGDPPNQPTQRPRIQYDELEDGLAQLPSYSRSLLKIRVPVMVTLAEAKQPVQNVLDIGPGSIIHFNKPCEDTLSLEIAGQKIALGEAVKVGDKFGLWITSMILPAERFWVISSRTGSERAK
jgi:flagellar motor switch protein FliN/FliY